MGVGVGSAPVAERLGIPVRTALERATALARSARPSEPETPEPERGTADEHRDERAMTASRRAPGKASKVPPPTTTIVVMGVTGTGKSTVMGALADRLGWATAEGDDFHSAANVEKMRSGRPLTDSDRRPWLEAVASWIGERERAGESAIVACSALRRAYRDVLRRDHKSVWFAHLAAPTALIADRLERRRGHYMPPSLLTSQLETLEPLDPDEPGAVFAANRPPDEIAADIGSRQQVRD
jgi:gluconokinase